MKRNLLLAIVIVLCVAWAFVDRAVATTVTLDLDPGAIYAAPDLQALQGMLANCCDSPDGSGLSGANSGTNNIGFGNSGSNNIGIGNGGSRNIGAYNGRGNLSSTSGNRNLGIGNGNGNESTYSGNRNIGKFNGNQNGIGTIGGETTYNGNGNVGSYNGNLNGVGNVGTGNGSYNGNDNVGFHNGNENGGGNAGALNGNGNGNGNVGAYSGNVNGNGNIGYGNGNENGNGNTGMSNGNENGNDNAGSYNGNWNGNANRGHDNGSWNGSGNLGNDNGNWNGNGNSNALGIGPDQSGGAPATAAFGEAENSLHPAAPIWLAPGPTASDGEAVAFGAFENTYAFTLDEPSDLQFGGIAVGILDFNIALCATPSCSTMDFIDRGHAVPGLLSVAGGWDSNLRAVTYFLLVSGFGARGGGAYLVGVIATPLATAPLPATALMLLTGMAALAWLAMSRRKGPSLD